MVGRSYLYESDRMTIISDTTEGTAEIPIFLTPSEEEELLEAAEQIRRGEYVDGEELVRELRSWLQNGLRSGGATPF
jgi:hypothetical protein